MHFKYEPTCEVKIFLLHYILQMSKSAENDNSRINLLDPPDVIAKKIKRCKTDQESGFEWVIPLYNSLFFLYQIKIFAVQFHMLTRCVSSCVG